MWESVASELVKYGIIFAFLSFPFFLFFSSFTMRMLRRLAKGTDLLGSVDLYSGSDISRVCTTLSLSRRWMKREDPDGINPFRANSDFVYNNIAVAERCLARIVFYLTLVGVFLMFLGAIVNLVGLGLGYFFS